LHSFPKKQNLLGCFLSHKFYLEEGTIRVLSRLVLQGRVAPAVVTLILTATRCVAVPVSASTAGLVLLPPAELVPGAAEPAPGVLEGAEPAPCATVARARARQGCPAACARDAASGADASAPFFKSVFLGGAGLRAEAEAARAAEAAAWALDLE
jgi:hypothetical protein